jgi:hypothetical protein
MEVRFTATRSAQRRLAPRRWRRLFAALISVAFALSFFHGLSFDADDGVPVMSMAQAAGDMTGKALTDKALTDKTLTDKTPAHPAPLHGDHCLTHLSSVAPQEAAIAIEYVAHGYRIVSLRSPDGACPRSPFEPPRA